MTHSTSLRASGSEILPSTLVASSWRFLRTRSIACLTAVRSIGEVVAVAAMAEAIAGREFDKARGAAGAGPATGLEVPGTRGRGISGVSESGATALAPAFDA